MTMKLKDSDAMHFPKYQDLAQNPQGLLYKLLLYGPFRCKLWNQIGDHT